MNLIFDLGGVVFTWQPESLIQEIFPDNHDQERVEETIFHHADWVALDRGTLARDEAIQRAIRRTGLPERSIMTLMRRLPSLLVPIPQTISLLRRLQHDTDHHLFALSNMHLASIRHIEQQYPEWNLFHGIVISCYSHLVKPESAIYEYALERYALDPSETIFIDDSQANVDAAEKAGIQGILFEKPEQCEQALEKLGILHPHFR